MNQENKATLILIATTMLAGAGWIFSKQSISGMPPFGFIALRFICAAMLLTPFCYRSLKQISRTQLLNATSVGVFMGASLLLWVHAISVTDTLAEGAFISSLSMLFVPLVAWVLFKHRPPRMFWLSLPFAILGLLLLSVASGFRTSPSQIWFLASAFTLALHFNFNAKYAQSIPSLVLACIQLLVTGILAFIASLLFETWPDSVANSTWVWFACSTILATSLRYVMQTVGQKLTTSANAAVIMILEPVWASSLSVFFYGDHMTATKLLGCGFILWSLFIYRGGARILEKLKLKYRTQG